MVCLQILIMYCYMITLVQECQSRGEPQNVCIQCLTLPLRSQLPKSPVRQVRCLWVCKCVVVNYVRLSILPSCEIRWPEETGSTIHSKWCQ